MSTVPRDFEIPMIEGRGHAINFATRYSAAFRLGPPRRHDRGDLGSDLARSRRRNLKVPCDLEGLSEAVLSPSVIAVTSTLGLMSMGTGLRSYAGERRQPFCPS
jgi:hypothetical protein